MKTLIAVLILSAAGFAQSGTGTVTGPPVGKLPPYLGGDNIGGMYLPLTPNPRVRGEVCALSTSSKTQIRIVIKELTVLDADGKVCLKISDFAIEPGDFDGTIVKLDNPCPKKPGK